MNKTVVEYFGRRYGSHCGYCDQDDTKFNHGMWAHSLRCEDYQNLINRGWRRSGKYCYKPVMHETCCPQYTIRCDVASVKLTKSQKKVIKRFNRFLLTGEKPQHNPQKSDDKQTSHTPIVEEFKDEPPNLQKMETSEMERLSNKDTVLPVQRQKKAKEIRIQNKYDKLEKIAVKKGIPFDPKSVKFKSRESHEKSIEDWMNEIPETAKIKFKTKLVRCSPMSREFRATFNDEYEIYKKYQIAIHHDDPSEVTEKQMRFVCKTADLDSIMCFLMFRRFLVDGPLQQAVQWLQRQQKNTLKRSSDPVAPDHHDDSEGADIPSTGLGAFHQQYYLNDKLVAVGVIDILPYCTSSVYCFYDPDYSFLSIGTYSALREIFFTRSLYQQCDKLRYYYMGFYIHTCTKMKYKGRYHPSYLLCPETYQWIPIEKCLLKLDKIKYTRLTDDENASDEKLDVKSAMVLYQRQAMIFSAFLRKYEPTQIGSQLKEVKEYVELAGKAAANMLLFRS